MSDLHPVRTLLMPAPEFECPSGRTCRLEDARAVIAASHLPLRFFDSRSNINLGMVLRLEAAATGIYGHVSLTKEGWDCWCDGQLPGVQAIFERDETGRVIRILNVAAAPRVTT